MTGGATIAFHRSSAAFSARRREARRGVGPGLGCRLRSAPDEPLPVGYAPVSVGSGRQRPRLFHAMHSISNALTFAVWENGQWMPSLTGSLVASLRAGREEARCDVGRGVTTIRTDDGTVVGFGLQLSISVHGA